ncbi:sigma-70 family RNA polymerase sigma factor [Glycomyces paridis]|uniref:Sigma-70 family RNA polymerase sigma factor n=1 Tax=Glycomyces paridis TaxID=2126555 RepID=A0A4S8PQX2_9ACTN|nr:sigma-70 family RNA polymerase sigma factor [Glycomyces paridis]THV30889.1 sigma-70 family RNA polymerase sigma factor [Glycomyces paridis]
MNRDFQVQRFEEHRDHLRAVAYRMLGSTGEADDALQETWIRFARTDTGEVENLRGWLTTVLSRVCLNLLRSRRTRREDALDADLPVAADPGPEGGPEDRAVLTDAVGHALQVVLDSLNPPERIAFVLHDLFGVPFDRVAAVLDRTPEAARQLASRARRRVRGGAVPDAPLQRAVVEAFLAAARDGRFEDLLEVLDPGITVVADEAAVATGFAGREVIGAKAVAAIFNGKARAAFPVLVDGAVGAMWAPGGTPRSVLAFTVAEGRVTAIAIVNDPDAIAALELTEL